jgi:uncharacterized protein YacL
MVVLTVGLLCVMGTKTFDKRDLNILHMLQSKVIKKYDHKCATKSKTQYLYTTSAQHKGRIIRY